MTFTACCFGGPKHGQVITANSSPFLVAMPTRLRYLVDDDPTPAAPGFKTGSYNRERFGYPPTRTAWDVLLWDGGWYQDRPVKDWVEDAARVCGFMALLLSYWGLAHTDDPAQLLERITQAPASACDICGGRGFGYLDRPCRLCAP